MLLLLQEGIKISGKIFEVHIKCFVCDRPAHSFVKCIKGHDIIHVSVGYYSCKRCTRGERYNKRTVYISSISSMREVTDLFEIKTNLSIISTSRL